MHVEQKRAQRRHVLRSTRQRQVTRHEHRHLPVEVVAGLQPQRPPCLLAEEIEPCRAREVREALPGRHRRAREHHGARSRVELLGKHLADVEPGGDESLRDHRGTSVERGVVDVVARLSVEHRHEPKALFGELHEDTSEVGLQIIEIRAGFFQLRDELTSGSDDLLELAGERAAYTRDRPPRARLPKSRVDSRLAGVVGRLADRAVQVLDEVEQRGGQRERGRHVLLGLGESRQDDALDVGRTGRPQRATDAVEQPALARSMERGEERGELRVAGLKGELLAGLVLDGVRLVDDPVAYRRQDPPVGDDITEEQSVVRHHDMRRRRPPPDPVQVTQVRVVTAALVRAIGDRCRRLTADGRAPVDVDRIQIAPRTLRYPGEQRCDRDQGLRRLVVERGDESVQLTKTRVVLVPLQCHVAQVLIEGPAQRGQLTVDELVHKRVRLGGDTHTDAVELGVPCDRHEIGQGLADPGPRLHGQMCTGSERFQDSLGHTSLLAAVLEPRIHPPCEPVRAEFVDQRLRVRAPALLEIVRIRHRLALVDGRPLPADLHEVEPDLASGCGHMCEDLPQRPVRAGSEIRDAAHERGWHGVDPAQQHAPHERERIGVVACAVRRRHRTERRCQVRQPMASQTGKRDQRQL